MEQSIKNQTAVTNLVKTLAREGRFSAELNGLVRDNAVKVKAHTIFVKKDISSAAGTIDFIDANTKKIIGVCNIEGTRLSKNEAFVFNKVEVTHGIGDATKMGGVALNTALPAALQHAVLVIKQGTSVIFEHPVSNFTSQGTSTSPEDKLLPLDAPSVLRDDEEISMQLRFAPGVAMADAAAAGSELIAQIKFLGFVTSRA